MTYKQSSSNAKQKIRPRLGGVILLIIIGWVSHQAIYAADSIAWEDTSKKARGKNNALLISTEQPSLSAEKDFDKIRSYQSYDPITKTWSAIEAFKEVEILEDATQHRDETYIYYSFWAYDTMDHQWKRVDIREYGYKYVQHTSDSATDMTKDAKNKFEFWKNLGLTFSVGGGSTYYVNKVNNLNLRVRKGQKEYFLQTPSSADAAQGKGYKIRWFSERPKRLNSIEHANVVNNQQSYDEAKGNISFHGLGFNIPVTAALHYTFFNKLRVGAGGNIEINYLRKLYPHGNAEHIPAYETSKPWFYNVKWFGTLGYKVFQQEKHAVVIDTQLGVVFDYGNRKASLQSLMEYEYASFYVSLGGAHEIKLNDFCKFFYRLSGQFKQYYNAADFAAAGDNKPSTSSITLWQPAIHLEIGTILNFGRDKNAEDEEDVAIEVDTPNQLADLSAVKQDNSIEEAYAAQPSQAGAQE